MSRADDIRVELSALDDEIDLLQDDGGDNDARLDNLYCRRADLEAELKEIEGKR